MHPGGDPERPSIGSSARVPAVVAIGAGVLLWYLPAILLPLVGQPLEGILRGLGLVDPAAGEFEGTFAAAQVLRWFAAALLVAFVLRVERAPASSLGIRRPRWTELLAAAGAGLAAVVVGIGLFVLVQGPTADAPTQTNQIVGSLSRLGKLQLIINAAVVEELFFRGFLIERVVAVTRRAWVGGIASVVLFLGSHFSGSGVTQTLTIVLAGSLTLVLLYLWRRNVWLCIVAHGIGNSPLLLS